MGDLEIEPANGFAMKTWFNISVTSAEDPEDMPGMTYRLVLVKENNETGEVKRKYITWAEPQEGKLFVKKLKAGAKDDGYKLKIGIQVCDYYKACSVAMDEVVVERGNYSAVNEMKGKEYDSSLEA